MEEKKGKWDQGENGGGGGGVEGGGSALTSQRAHEPKRMKEVEGEKNIYIYIYILNIFFFLFLKPQYRYDGCMCWWRTSCVFPCVEFDILTEFTRGT